MCETVRTYSVGKMVTALKGALTTTKKGLKVIIAESECMLARKRRENAEDAKRLKEGKRVEKARFGVDDNICTGDHSCIRMSGCPSLTIKPNPDPLRTDPVAHVNNGCVACGLCGEMAHAAILCPSFYRAQRTINAGWWERMHNGAPRGIGRLAGGRALDTARSAGPVREHGFRTRTGTDRMKSGIDRYEVRSGGSPRSGTGQCPVREANVQVQGA